MLVPFWAVCVSDAWPSDNIRYQWRFSDKYNCCAGADFSCVVIKKKMPDHQNVLSILLTMTGICLLTLQQSLVFHSGDILCLAGAAVYAVQILLTDKFAQEEDGMPRSIWQLGFAALYGVICTFMFETPTLPSSGFQWIAILGLAFVCSAFGFVMQPMAQKYTTPEHTGLLFA